jgi:ABC-2 type transport system permease protein
VIAHQFNAAATIAYRDLLRFLRDRGRLVSELIFPVIFVIGFGAGFQNTLGESIGIFLPAFVLTGTFAQTLFQSTALGMVWLIDDRNNNFTQEIFVSPISRFTIIFGKIAGEGLVAMAQGTMILLFGLLIGVRYDLFQIVGLLATGVLVCILGGAFGLLILANIGSRQAATQIFTFIMLPQYFLAGLFVPVSTFPWWLDLISRITPMRYAIDLVRTPFYWGNPEMPIVISDPLWLTLLVGTTMSVVFIVVGTTLFVRREKNR